jgi:hypothetical protein
MDQFLAERCGLEVFARWLFGGYAWWRVMWVQDFNLLIFHLLFQHPKFRPALTNCLRQLTWSLLGDSRRKSTCQIGMKK